MADKEDCSASLGNIMHLAQALLLKHHVADCQHLVDDQDFRLEVGGYGEGEAHVHARAVPLDGRVEKFLDLCKVDNLIELTGDFRPGHPENGAVQINVLAAGQLEMKSCAD